MTSRPTRSDKEKWVAGTYRSARRRSPVRITQCDTSALIEENKLTLIGRVTNPTVQKPKVVVNYMPQLWNLDSRVLGKDLGTECFQFKFENEADLQSVLKRGPYHFKNWMIILQQWEPVVSDSFPAFLSFWVKIHGIPLHFWSDQTIRTIGQELGAASARDVSEGRVRVPINELGPLEMSMPIRLPDGAIKTVELEYEKLEKHYFNCFELSHKKKDCSSPLVSRQLVQRLDSERRRQEERRVDRPPLRSGSDTIRGNRATDMSNLGPTRQLSALEDRRRTTSHSSRPSHASRPLYRPGSVERSRHRSRSPHSPRSHHYSVPRDLHKGGTHREDRRISYSSASAGSRPPQNRVREVSRSSSRRSPDRRPSPPRVSSKRPMLEPNSLQERPSPPSPLPLALQDNL